MTAPEVEPEPGKGRADGRYPYTYACDYVRGFCQDWRDVGGEKVRCPNISRAEAAAVMGAFEAVFGLSHEEMAKKLANQFIADGGA